MTEKEKIADEKQKFAMIFFATCQLQIDLVDELSGTSLHRHKLKSLSNSIQKECIREIDSFHSQLDSVQEDYYFKTVDMVETFIESVRTHKMDVMIHLLKEFNKGEIAIVDEKKHSKFLSQQTKI